MFRLIVQALAVFGASSIIAAAAAQPLEGTPAVSTPLGAAQGLQPLALKPHLSLLLPTRSPDFARAAEAVRNGVLAARDVLMPDMEVVVVDTDDVPEHVQAAYREAAKTAPAAIIGPLTRPAVQAIASEVEVLTPTIALNAVDTPVPPNVYQFALQIEVEARQVARLAVSDLRARDPSRRATAVVITSNAPLQKRATQAFIDAYTAEGGSVLATIDIGAERGNALQTRLAATAPAEVFLAIDAPLASAVRPYLRDVVVYGTSQLNTRAEPGRLIDLEGIHFVDMPWLVQRDAPAVSRFARSDALAKYSADLERLYAMGIDAFRIATDAASGRSPIGFDGVTGVLLQDGQRIERRALPAVIRDGEAVPDGQ